LSIYEETLDAAESTIVDGEIAAWQASDIMLSVLSDGLDHPELWPLVPELAAENSLIPDVLRNRGMGEPDPRVRVQLQTLLALCLGHDEALAMLMPLNAAESQNVQVQGALFRIESLLDPGNPKYQLKGKICPKPFLQLDVLENATHLCCASWLPTSTGDLTTAAAQDVWNGEKAQAIRASIFDGSYRYCNKRTCPWIQSDQLRAVEQMEAEARWRVIVKEHQTAMPHGPEMVNLAYDRTCNLSCPSCRTERYAADDATRLRINAMQERAILPLLKNAKTVVVTGSGDPFASKNFRGLMQQLDAGGYPDLKFIIMTNGMLFTRRQWAEFPSLHGRVQSLRVSLDAATGPTHELLRRGARWSVMQENLKFAGELLAAGLIDEFMITFIVQAENYREMGDAVDLAREIGASKIYFARITNWGTFTAAEYREKAVFVPGHPRYEDFLAVTRDPRLRDPIMAPTDLDEFIRAA